MLSNILFWESSVYSITSFGIPWMEIIPSDIFDFISSIRKFFLHFSTDLRWESLFSFTFYTRKWGNVWFWNMLEKNLSGENNIYTACVMVNLKYNSF